MKHESTPANVARAAFVLLSTLLGISVAVGNDPGSGWIGGLAGLGFGLSLLFFIDQNITSAIVNNPQNK